MTEREIQKMHHDYWDAWAEEMDPRDIESSPMKLYFYSRRTAKKLPQNLHEAMLLWSFDEEGKPYAKAYLNWIDECERRVDAKVRFERKCLLMTIICWLASGLSFFSFFWRVMDGKPF